MDTPSFSRRTALARGLRLGAAAAIAAAIGCDLEAPGSEPARLDATPVAPPVVASPDATVAPTATPTPPPRVVRLAISPTGLAIPALGIDAPIASARVTQPAGGPPEIVVPESGIVSPNHLLGALSVNNLWVLGHSRWRRIPQLLYTLGDLVAGDQIEVSAVEQDTERALPALSFEVERLVVADVEATARYFYGPTPESPRLLIQTSARQAWDPEWILDRDVLLAKADIDVAGDLDDLSRYLLLLVTARLRPDALAALIAIA